MRPQIFMEAAKKLNLKYDTRLFTNLYICPLLKSYKGGRANFVYFSKLFNEGFAANESWFSSSNITQEDFRYETGQIPYLRTVLTKETQLQRTLALLFCYEMSNGELNCKPKLNLIVKGN